MAENKPKEQRYIEILDAAARCFATNGYLGTSVNDICREAELTKGGLYWHFPSKKHILEAILEYYCDRWRGEWKRLEEIDLNDDAIYQAGLTFIRNNIASADKVRLNIMLEAETIRDPALFAIMTESKLMFMKDLVGFSKRVLEFYGNTSITPEELACIFDNQVTGIVKYKVLYDTGLDVEAVWKANFELIRKGIA